MWICLPHHREQVVRPGLAGMAQVYGDYYSEIGPATNTVNLRFSKWWRFGAGRKLTFSFEVRNLLGHTNYRRVNAYTGDGYQVGDRNPQWVDRWSTPEDPISTDSEAYAKGVVDPSYIVNPRVLLWGVSYQW